MKNLSSFMKFFGAVATASLCTLSAAQTPPGSSAYFTDKAFTFNEDKTSEAFKLINVVACYIRMMAPEKAVNLVGDQQYVAMVNPDICDSEEGGASIDASGNASNNVVFEDSVVEVNVLPDGTLRAKIWLNSIFDDANVGATRIYIDARIVGGPAKKPPFGEWEVNWCTLIPGEDTGNSEPDCYERGHARVDASGGRAFFQYQEDEGIETVTKTMSVLGEIANDQASGGGKFSTMAQSSLQNSPRNTNFEGTYAFSSSRLYGNFVEDGSSAETCRIPSSEAPGAYTSAWETWLYNPSTGARVTRDSGFSIRDQNGVWGWAGYWGVHINDRNNELQSGEQLKRYDSNGRLIGTYEVSAAKGKLKKVTTSNRTLSEVEGIPFKWGTNRKNLTGIDAHDNQWVNANTMWNGTQFVVTGYDRCTNNGCSFESLQPEKTFSILDIAGEGAGQLNQSSMWGWREGTGESFEILLAEWSQTNNTWSRTVYSTASTVNVYSRSETTVVPGDTTAGVPDTLHCVGSCVDFVGGSLVKTDDLNVVTPRQFSWNSTTGMLNLGSSPIDFSGPGDSFHSGALVATADLPKIACQVGGQNGYCQSQVNRSGITYYQWESGPNQWNQFSGIKDVSTGAAVTFQAPLIVMHTVVDQRASASYRGKQVSLQYPGNGQLWVPSFCFDPVTLQRLNNCNGNNIKWAQEFMIPSDVTTGFVTDDANNRYLVRHLRKGLYFPNANNLNECDPLKAVAIGYSSQNLPSISDWKNPANPSSTNYIGSYQSPVGMNVLVINGELQD